MKRLALTLASLLLVLGSVPMVFAADFPDVPASHPNYTAIMFLKTHGVVQGYEDGTYKPGRNVTRSEFLKIIMLSAGHTIPSVPLASAPFPDVAANYWAAGYIKAAVDLDVVHGYDDGLFRPDRTVSRVEALKMMLKANGITEFTLPDGTSYADVAGGVWYHKFALYALTAHLFDAGPGNTMNPDLPLTRALVAEMVYRFYQYRPDLLPGATPTPTPTPTSGTFSVTSVSAVASPASYTAPCAATLDFTFHATVNTSHSPGTVTYHWEGSDGSMGGNETVTFASGEISKVVDATYTFGSAASSGWKKVVVTSPNAASSNQANFTINCATTSNSVTGVIYTWHPNQLFVCGFTNNYTIDADVQLAGTGVAGMMHYRWHYLNGGIGPWLDTGYSAGATHLLVTVNMEIQNIWANGDYDMYIEITGPTPFTTVPIVVHKTCP